MARFCGEVGFAYQQETAPGVYDESDIFERVYKGDLLKNSRRLQSGENVVNDIVTTNRVSILADAYAQDHFFAIRYVRWQGVCWKVTEVEVQRPRLILTLGEVYHGPTA